MIGILAVCGVGIPVVPIGELFNAYGARFTAKNDRCGKNVLPDDVLAVVL
jgi:hypothetical protein